jgi:hypothetical protein
MRAMIVLYSVVINGSLSQAWLVVVILQDSVMRPDEPFLCGLKISTGIRTASGSGGQDG